MHLTNNDSAALCAALRAARDAGGDEAALRYGAEAARTLLALGLATDARVRPLAWLVAAVGQDLVASSFLEAAAACNAEHVVSALLLLRFARVTAGTCAGQDIAQRRAVTGFGIEHETTTTERAAARALMHAVREDPAQAAVCAHEALTSSPFGRAEWVWRIVPDRFELSRAAAALEIAAGLLGAKASHPAVTAVARRIADATELLAFDACGRGERALSRRLTAAGHAIARAAFLPPRRFDPLVHEPPACAEHETPAERFAGAVCAHAVRLRAAA